jgi:hypothetical protein
MGGVCPLCGREYDEHRRCFDCNSADCAICHAATGGFFCHCCQTCCDRAKADAKRESDRVLVEVAESSASREGRSVKVARRRVREMMPEVGLFGANTDAAIVNQLLDARRKK